MATAKTAKPQKQAETAEMPAVPASPETKGLRLHLEQIRLKNFKVFQDAVMEHPWLLRPCGPGRFRRRTLFDAIAFL
ncbi:MAG: hypothetical protein K6C33_04870 [Desulfovibrio sp.]|nr:hypothetical protein [Desulfovibrio sp.]